MRISKLLNDARRTADTYARSPLEQDRRHAYEHLVDALREFDRAYAAAKSADAAGPIKSAGTSVLMALRSFENAVRA